MTDRWIVDLHSHTHYSKDCIVRFEWIIEICEKRGIDRLAITDHNTADSALAMQQIAPQLVIPGEEIMTTQGEILGYFVTETIPAGLSPEETIGRLRQQGAVISVSHPFDRLRKGAWQQADLERILPLVDAIEVFNSRCLFPADNARAQAFAQAHGKLGTAGSDAHSRVEYGNGALKMNPFSGPSEFLAALSTAEVVGRLSSAFVHVNSSTAKWMKKAGLRKRV